MERRLHKILLLFRLFLQTIPMPKSLRLQRMEQHPHHHKIRLLLPTLLRSLSLLRMEQLQHHPMVLLNPLLLLTQHRSQSLLKIQLPQFKVPLLIILKNQSLQGIKLHPFSLLLLIQLRSLSPQRIKQHPLNLLLAIQLRGPSLLRIKLVQFPLPLLITLNLSHPRMVHKCNNQWHQFPQITLKSLRLLRTQLALPPCNHPLQSTIP
jgi:hypothetical protein